MFAFSWLSMKGIEDGHCYPSCEHLAGILFLQLPGFGIIT